MDKEPTVMVEFEVNEGDTPPSDAVEFKDNRGTTRWMLEVPAKDALPWLRSDDLS